jgi:hypothetical protein
LDFLQAALGSIVSITAFALLVAGVLKTFQIATDLGEIKDLLRDIKRNTQDYSAPASKPVSAMDPEEVLRALRTGDYDSPGQSLPQRSVVQE